jgi:hypothetical protein
LFSVRRFITLLLAIAALAAAAAAPVSASSIEFEYLETDDITIQHLDCNPEGTSSATLSVAGIAGGPHPGPFEATITFRAGPFGFEDAPLVELNETFEIASGDTVITGTKQLIPFDPNDIYYPFDCSVTPSGECEHVTVSARAPNEALGYQATIAGPDGTRLERGFAELSIDTQVLRCGGVVQESSSWFSQFFTRALPPQEPATIVLSPASSVNTVGSFHELTATVSDENGEPFTGAVVRFTVEGATSASGLCRSDGGECTFAYQVSPFPGEDTITAYVDANGNGVHDPGEPASTATKTIVLPASTVGRTTGEGKFLENRTGAVDEVKFTLAARNDGTTLRGECTIVDKDAGVTITCLDVLAYVQHGADATIYGHAEQNGVPTLYRISVTDNGQGGGSPADVISVLTAEGYGATGTVTSGDVKVR